MGGCLQVAVVGAQAIVSAGLRAILGAAPDIDVVDMSSTSPPPDVVIYDVIDIERDAGATLDDLVDRYGARVVVLGRALRPSLEARAHAHHAVAGFSLESDVAEILETVRVAARNPLQAPKPHQAAAYTWAHSLGLTAREFDVLSGITRGLSNADIAALHVLSLNSIKSYIRSAYRKTGVSSRSQAVAWCLEHGFEPPRPPRTDPSAQHPTTTTIG